MILNDEELYKMNELLEIVTDNKSRDSINVIAMYIVGNVQERELKGIISEQCYELFKYVHARGKGKGEMNAREIALLIKFVLLNYAVKLIDLVTTEKGIDLKRPLKWKAKTPPPPLKPFKSVKECDYHNILREVSR